MPAFVAILKAVDFAEIRRWKQGTVLHTHSELREIGLQNTLISIWSNHFSSSLKQEKKEKKDTTFEFCIFCSYKIVFKKVLQNVLA